MRILTQSIIAVVALVCALNVEAQQTKSSSGTYRSYLNEQPFGVENYSLAVNADGSARSEADVTFGDAKYHANTDLLNNKPKRIEMSAPAASPVVVEFGNGVIKVKLVGQPDQEMKPQPAAVLENGCWHHYVFLLGQYDFARRGKQSFSGFLPSQAVPFDVQVELVDSPKFEVKAQPVKTDHFRVSSSTGLAMEIWADNQHVPLVLSVPAQQLKSVRKGYEDLAAVILSTSSAR